MDARCQCGSVTFKTPLPQPLALYVCHCSECRRQTGSAFGTSAIFPQFSLPASDLLSCYTCVTLGRRRATDFFGSYIVLAKNVVSVKGGCIEGLDWSKAIHIWTKSAMVPIPESSESHSEESGFTDYGDSQEVLDQPSDLTGSGANLEAEVQAERALAASRVTGACELSGH
ncbi:hypothetical protein S40285_09045 [Stachybotrys chlorohalonatus IBT 40285]|uniref:CENP-V/GFA domain-containing protein n=1 Tax=Stachybotrys chlorohalonatus (strain IBT 40285) TaxID=1283841 RepID=A0A084QLL5_STAC4|nr:hypothetical protein S40285_09045 [Stachybotrys chlorohalonata IBT 40285]